MNRYKVMFNNKKNTEKIFVPFLILGDPNLKQSIKIIKTVISSGADAIELGIPFSDPLADGPIIQKSNKRALKNKISIKKIFKTIKKIRKENKKLPIGLLIYANLIFNFGIKKFYYYCYKSGIDSVLIPDVPIQESYEFRKYSLLNKISSIYICPPNANNILIKKISKYSQDYVYLVSRTGVTGIHKKNTKINIKIINMLIKNKSAPILNGFGINKCTNIKLIFKSGISGIICGSKIISLIEKYLLNENKMLKKIKKLCIFFKKSTYLK
ncbi:tryptophan synthase subunit alpha [Buchnera aphidicola]|uniref:tryptophan synthase subunit alpha n=1 Tax=Buchnera aphidicola TaxID=9 RepID=UPI0022376222|nr:tryptophan synthase subunit alpha [Buchnera aphidicola]MCW5197687.1 tryptophan synthase subunit alpha [Buchnera aphidicola (Chaitophorus viminalis)]